ncbi:MAG: hypothetical protein QOH60_1670 [Mycobacterium sp.]|nr:hypothetical protein [Mycobacterium sp.]
MQDFAQRTVELARQNVAEGGRPFATVIVKDGRILPMRYEPRDDAVEVYRFWQENNGCDRRVSGALQSE